MSAKHETIITFLSEGLPYHVNIGREAADINLSAQVLLDISAYVDANRAKLEQEARADSEHNVSSGSDDTVEVRPIKQEWRYRTSDLLL